MSKQSIKSIRRDELVDAAISVIAQDGIAGATVARIATHAGMSPGLVNHYFDGKDELLSMILRRLSNLLRDEIRRLTPPEATPHQQLRAIIDACFAPQLYVPGAQEAWLQFGVQAYHAKGSERLRRINTIIGKRFWSNIGFAFRQILPAGDVEDAIDGLVALIDGFSWRFLIEPASADFPLARRICWDYVRRRGVVLASE